jgi:hypothetical protein
MDALRRYRCPVCRELHQEKADAKTCCEPFTREVWICANCKQEYTLRTDAAFCCHNATPLSLCAEQPLPS